LTLDPEAIRDLFAGLGAVRTRRMFGGQGVYAGDVMFALEASGELYLKADDSVLPAFQAAGSRPFVYEKDGRIARMSYWRLPDGAADDPDEAARWGRLAIAAARRAAAARTLKGVKPRRATRRKAAPHP
jgi:DNA transformation protein and related proteins